MIEKKIIEDKKREFEIKEFIREKLGKGKASEIKIEHTPLGEKIIITTSKPGLVIGRGGEIIQEMSETLKKKFGLENPHIEVNQIENPLFDAQTVADEIALALERYGPLAFKLIAYRKLEDILKAGALGAEIRLSGKLPSERARSWRFAFGYLKKTGESAKKVVRTAKSVAFTKPGTIGVKVSIVPKDAKIPDKIEINKEAIEEKLKELIKKEEEKTKVEEKEKKE
ncbi:MAG TPA: 30S ribosomal protein S3 [Candidatus Pacearchaeota archaeon]|nr:30S ribosomal protein S3 [Candidatus Pacearchaeota archaeon]